MPPVPPPGQRRWRRARDEKWDERPVVAAVLRAGATADAAQLRRFLADKFARWQLPERWTFLTEVPKTSVGKFDKKRLRARYAAGDLDVVTVAADVDRFSAGRITELPPT